MMRRCNYPEWRGPQAFSLLEMTMVLTMILLVASIAQPIYQNPSADGRARESASRRMRDTLYSTRVMIDRFTLDNKRPPESEMVEAGY